MSVFVKQTAMLELSEELKQSWIKAWVAYGLGDSEVAARRFVAWWKRLLAERQRAYRHWTPRVQENSRALLSEIERQLEQSGGRGLPLAEPQKLNSAFWAGRHLMVMLTRQEKTMEGAVPIVKSVEIRPAPSRSKPAPAKSAAPRPAAVAKPAAPPEPAAQPQPKPEPKPEPELKPAPEPKPEPLPEAEPQPEPELEVPEVEAVQEEEVSLEATEMDLDGLDLGDLDAADLDLGDMDLEGLELDESELEGLDLEGVDLEGIDLEGVDLEGLELDDDLSLEG